MRNPCQARATSRVRSLAELDRSGYIVLYAGQDEGDTAACPIPRSYFSVMIAQKTSVPIGFSSNPGDQPQAIEKLVRASRKAKAIRSCWG